MSPVSYLFSQLFEKYSHITFKLKLACWLPYCKMVDFKVTFNLKPGTRSHIENGGKRQFKFKVKLSSFKTSALAAIFKMAANVNSILMSVYKILKSTALVFVFKIVEFQFRLEQI